MRKERRTGEANADSDPALFAYVPKVGSHCAATVSGLHLFPPHKVDVRRELPRTLIGTVHTVGNGDKPDPMLPEQDLGIEARLQIVTPDTAHILGDHTADFPGLNVCHKLFPTGPLKICPAPSVVRVMGNVSKSSLGSIAFKHGLLIHNGIAVPNLLIVTAKAFV